MSINPKAWLAVRDLGGGVEVREIVTEADAPAAMSAGYELTPLVPGTALAKWQPIETAPKDGTAILVSNGHGVWIAKHKAVYQSGYNPESPWFCLMLNKDHIPGKFRAGKPTHWMPLPDAPEAARAEVKS